MEFFDIPTFNGKKDEDKILYLFNCLTEVDESFLITHKEEFKKPKYDDMIYMLKLIKKYDVGGKEDDLIIQDYNKYLNTK